MSRKTYANLVINAVHFHEGSTNTNSYPSISFHPCEADTCMFEYPLKIMLPQFASENNCQWVYPIIFGGGLVEGDNINFCMKIGAKCSVLITSLSFPKVYCCENGISSEQHAKYEGAADSLLCVLPDPLVCFKNASYIQSQSFYLERGANIVFLDWYTSGRYERGERWDFSKLKSVSSVYIGNKLLFKEACNLENTPLLSVKRAMKSYNICGICFVIGEYLSFLSQGILSEVGKCKVYGEKYRSDLMFAASPLIENTNTVGCIVRFAAESVPQAVKELEKLLDPLFVVIGGNPFERK